MPGELPMKSQIRREPTRRNADSRRARTMSVQRTDELSYRYYERAVCNVVDRISTRIAPWTLVEANSKYCARIKVLKTICQALEDGLERQK